MPRVLETPRPSTSQGAAPIFACMVRYTPKPFTNRLTAARNILATMAPGVRFCSSSLSRCLMSILTLSLP